MNEQDLTTQEETFQVQFTGDAKTFFGIWIVNLMLSIVTLGIYSAWAKVRTKRYFAQNTLIDERRFDYHATGKQILIGRIIVVIGYVVFQGVSAIQPIVGIILAVGLLFVMPYLINRSLAFNARMTSFSGLRFGFEGKYWRAVLVFFVYPILSMLTLYLTFPFLARAQHRYYASHHRFGATHFNFESSIKPFYKAFLLALLWMVVILAVGAIAVVMPAVVSGAFASNAAGDPTQMIFAILGIYVFVFLAILPAAFIYRAYIRNATYAGTSLGETTRFTSTIKPAKFLWIAVSNAVATVMSLGLLSPWARVRMARYTAAHTYVTVTGSIDDFIGGEREKISALGDAFTDFEGIDVDFAL